MKVNSQGISQMYRIPGRELRIDPMSLLAGILTIFLLLLPGRADAESATGILFSHPEAVEGLNRALSMGLVAFVILFFLLGKKRGKAFLTLIPAMVFLWKYWIPMRDANQDASLSGLLAVSLWAFVYLTVRYGFGKRLLAAWGSVFLCLAATELFWIMFGSGNGILFGGILLGASGAVFYTAERILAAMERTIRWQSGLTWKEAALVGMSTGRMNMGLIGIVFLSGCVGAALAFYAMCAFADAWQGTVDLELAFGLLESLLAGFGLLLIIPGTAVMGGIILTGANTKKKQMQKETDRKVRASIAQSKEIIWSKEKGNEMANQCYDNRELSWLKFNERVLEEAEDSQVPLWERLNFTAIFQSNLDEFYMVRVGSLHDQRLISEEIRENKTNMTCVEQIQAILKRTKELGARKDGVYRHIMEQLREQGTELVGFSELSEEDKEYLKQYFATEVRPFISPQIVGKRQPFPFLKNKEIYAVMSLVSRGGNEKIGIIPCGSGVFERLIPIPAKEDKKRYLLAEDLILHYAPQVFECYRLKSKTLIRITRNADIDADEAVFDEDLDYRDAMEQIIKQRKKLCPVRMEISRELDKSAKKKLCKYLDLDESQVFLTRAPLDLSFVYQLGDLLRTKSELFYPRRVPQKSPMVQSDVPMMEQIRKGDLLLSYPYESMKPFLKLLEEAAEDENVISIKMTLYRLAKNSKVVEALVEAAENGKEVMVLVELRARFDEENNIEWSRRLESAGCRIIYGLNRIKVHSKLCLITRKVDNHVEYITQIGTGNYNEKTSKIYTDLSLMTSSPEIGMEAAKIFNALALGEVVEHTDYLLAAPKCLQNRVLEMIDQEIKAAERGEEAYLGFKINSLTDKAIIDKLIQASKAGVKIDLIVRGICCLVAGSPNATENIRVISIVGRYLEHSRIYLFGPKDRRRVYIGSADFMTRNTLRRVEVAVPVCDEEIRERIEQMFDRMLADNVKARIQNPDGTYRRAAKGEPEINSQELFFEQAYENSKA